MNSIQIKSIKPIVEKLLTDYPQYRDDDRRLLAHIWMIQLGINTMKTMSLYDFMKQYVDNHALYTPDHISRLRRKIQEDNVHLRGEGYNKRQKLEKEVRDTFSNK